MTACYDVKAVQIELCAATIQESDYGPIDPYHRRVSPCVKSAGYAFYSPTGFFAADVTHPCAGHGADDGFLEVQRETGDQGGEKNAFFSRNKVPAGEKPRKLIDDN